MLYKLMQVVRCLIRFIPRHNHLSRVAYFTLLLPAIFLSVPCTIRDFIKCDTVVGSSSKICLIGFVICRLLMSVCNDVFLHCRFVWNWCLYYAFVGCIKCSSSTNWLVHTCIIEMSDFDHMSHQSRFKLIDVVDLLRGESTTWTKYFDSKLEVT